MSNNENEDKGCAFYKVGRSGNLLRPQKDLSSSQSSPAPVTKNSNLYRSNEVKNLLEIVHEEEPLEPESKTAAPVLEPVFPAASPPPVAAAPPLFVWSMEDYQKGVVRFGEFLEDKSEKLRSAEEAQLFFSILEKQAKQDSSFCGFFELMRELDPNRARPFRMRILESLRAFLPEKPVAKTLTEAWTMEWKDSQKSGSSYYEPKTADDRKKQNPKKLKEQLDYNSRIPRWISLFKALKRKQAGMAQNHLNSFYKLKEGFVSRSFLYMLNPDEGIEKDFRGQLGNVFSQFKNDHRDLFLAFRDESREVRQEVYKFLKTVYFAVTLVDILEQHVNILKLDGAAAQSLCPDKKNFILGHLKRIYSEAIEAEAGDLGDFAAYLSTQFAASDFSECIYNRKDIFVKAGIDVGGKTRYITIYGASDNIDGLKVSMETGI